MSLDRTSPRQPPRDTADQAGSSPPESLTSTGTGDSRAHERVVVITPWYPAPARPYDGIFVAESCAALATQGVATEVIHLVNTATQELPESRAGVRRVPFDAPPGTSRADVASRQQTALAEVAETLAAATVVHVHVGIPTGAAVAAVLPDHVRLVVTEHATYLATELTYEAGRSLYARVLARSHRVLMVSDVEARRLRATFPHLRDRVRVLGNPVRCATEPRDAGAGRDRWLYVGNLITRKGVLRLVEAFALWCRSHPDAQLTMAGGGELEGALRALAEERGIADRVQLLGPVDPADLGALLDDADVLVHLSELETFGMTVVEAAVVGLPVVVARSGGPDEVLARAAESGVVRFVATRPAPAEVVAAVRASAEVDGRDADLARDELRRSFGPEAIGRKLEVVLSGRETALAGRPLMLVAASPAGHHRLAELAAYALRQELPVVAVVTDPAVAASLDARVDVVVLGRNLAFWPHRLVDTLILDRIPGAVLDVGAAALAGTPRWRGRASRAVSRLRARHRKLVSRARVQILHPLVYRHVDPWLALRGGEAQAIAAARRHAPGLVVVTDPESRAAGQVLARALPDVRVTSDVLLRDIDGLRALS